MPGPVPPAICPALGFLVHAMDGHTGRRCEAGVVFIPFDFKVFPFVGTLDCWIGRLRTLSRQIRIDELARFLSG